MILYFLFYFFFRVSLHFYIPHWLNPCEGELRKKFFNVILRTMAVYNIFGKKNVFTFPSATF